MVFIYIKNVFTIIFLKIISLYSIAVVRNVGVAKFY